MNLVCDRKMYKAHASMIYMVGYVFGVFSSGVSADRYFHRLIGVFFFHTCTEGFLSKCAFTKLYSV